MFTALATSVQMPAATPFAGDPAIVREQLAGLNIGALFGAPSTAGDVAPATRITLNVFDHVFVGVFERVDLSAQGSSWVGALEGLPNSHVVITEGDGVVSGQFSTPADVYQVQTIAAGVHQVRQVAPARLTESDQWSADALADTGVSPSLAKPGTDDPSQIDVLVLYTPRAESALGGPSWWVSTPCSWRVKPIRRSSAAA